MKVCYKKLKNSIDSDASNSSDWFLPPRTLEAVKKTGRIRIIKNSKIKNKLHAKTADAKFVFDKITNELDKVVSKNMCRHKLNSLDLTNQAFKECTSVILASVYDPNDKIKIIKEHLLVLIDSGSSHSMAKALLVNKYKENFFREEKLV